MEGRNLCLDITFDVSVEEPHAIKGKCSLFSFSLKVAELRPLVPGGGRCYVFWAVLLFLAVLILAVVLVARQPKWKGN